MTDTNTDAATIAALAELAGLGEAQDAVNNAVDGRLDAHATAIGANTDQIGQLAGTVGEQGRRLVVVEDTLYNDDTGIVTQLASLAGVPAAVSALETRTDNAETVLVRHERRVGVLERFMNQDFDWPVIATITMFVAVVSWLFWHWLIWTQNWAWNKPGRPHWYEIHDPSTLTRNTLILTVCCAGFVFGILVATWFHRDRREELTEQASNRVRRNRDDTRQQPEPAVPAPAPEPTNPPAGPTSGPMAPNPPPPIIDEPAPQPVTVA